ncbi:hypothetical protein GE061_011028 [Apolygus lucorum]|uniref:Uncharacterized protein n=1 Tax=Apolygus lucorum TaxID=248454 RepID=A0A8S9XW89_APOLU|nr:hypothetical protein GE061_011028 [Apolygus lucorum]
MFETRAWSFLRSGDCRDLTSSSAELVSADINKMSRKRAPTTSQMMGGEDIVAWAKAMGYPGADSPEFKANAGRLVTPQLKNMWRHLIKHVRPANEVAHIRRKLVEYKLGFENNTSVNPSISQKKFETVADYEAFLKKSALQAKLTHCDILAEKKQEEIKTQLNTFSHKGEEQQSQKLKEKEQMEKIRLLRAKRESLEQQVATFKQLNTVLDSVKQPNYSFKIGQTSDSWGLEIQRYCSSLERGKEMSMMCEHLGETLKIANSLTFKGRPCSGNKDSRFHLVVEEYYVELGLKFVELQEKYDTLLKQVEAKKQNLISSMTSSGEVSQIALAEVLKTFLDSGNLESIGKRVEMNFLVQWIANNKTRVDSSLNSSYFEERERIAELDNMIDVVQDEISTILSFPTTELRSSLADTVSKMKAEAAAACYTEETMDASVNKILSDLPQLIELIKKIQLTDKKMDLGTHSIQAYVDLKSGLSRSNIVRSLTSLDISLKDSISESTGSTMMKQVGDKVSRDKSRMEVRLNNLTGTLKEIDELLQNIDGHLDCWETGIATDVICNNPDYQDLLKRLKNVVAEK